MSPAAIWRAVAGMAAHRPLLFFLVSLLLAGTNLMLWRMGAYDGGAAQAGAGARIAFLAAKLVVLLVWALLALRLVQTPDAPAGEALRLDRRQAGWIAGVLLLLPFLFGLRIALTRLAGLAVPDPRMALIAALILYLAVSLALLVRLLPAWIGVLLGDRAASLAWSWRATKGYVVRSVLLVMAAIAPAAALHIGLNLFWMANAPLLRAALLLADGGAMALLMAIAMASYRALYLRAKS
ncbi:MAG TPA: hypothetical protein VGO55_05245 [Allosphingosinicella sp.]|jgi:hypothetical protein|nr:hypothetical protein [Allosphingosinicella sp.]